MIPVYRKNYDGEFVVSEVRLAEGGVSPKREWIPNAIENHHISGRAAVIGSATNPRKFPHTILQKHRGGLLGKNRLQTYGSGDLWTTMTFDFFVTTDRKQITGMIDAGYDTQSTVYTSPKHILENPGRFYIIPMMPQMDNLAISLYLAAFDGHKEIFMLGYNEDTPAGSNTWINDVADVIASYNLTKFWIVGGGNAPEIWRNRRNVELIDYRRFISYCDI